MFFSAPTRENSEVDPPAFVAVASNVTSVSASGNVAETVGWPLLPVTTDVVIGNRVTAGVNRTCDTPAIGGESASRMSGSSSPTA